MQNSPENVKGSLAQTGEQDSRNEFAPFLDHLVQTAHGHKGKFTVFAPRVDPDTGQPDGSPLIEHVTNIGDAPFITRRLRLAIERMAAIPGANVQVGLSLVRDDVPILRRGTEADITGVLAIRIDFDADNDPATRHERLPVFPHMEIETSPGNFHVGYFFDKPYPVHEAKPVLQALVRCAGADKGAQSCDGGERPPGTMNYPNAKKRKAGRKPVRTVLRYLDQDGLDCISLPDLKAAILKKYPYAFDVPQSASGAAFDWEERHAELAAMAEEQIYRKLNDSKWLKTKAGRSGGTFKFIVECYGRGYTAEEAVDTMLKHPSSLLIGHYAEKNTDVEHSIRDDVKRVYEKQIEAERKTTRQEPASAIVEIRAGELSRMTDEAEAALIKADVPVFQYGQRLMQPGSGKGVTSDGKEQDTLILVPVTEARLNDLFSRYVNFQKYVKSEGKLLSANCPPDLSRTYLSRTIEWKVRRLSGITQIPMLRADGTILDKPGYDEKSKLWFDPGDLQVPLIPEHPTREDGLAALQLFKNVLREFPFVSKEALAVALAAFLTALVRRTLPTAPLFAFTAPTAGSGKSYLVDLIAILLTGKRCSVMTQPDDEAELEKRLDSELMKGSPIIALDNCEHPLTGKALDTMTSQTEKSPRKLGRSETVPVLCNNLLTATGNNLAVAADMCRRVVVCEIDAGVERPETRHFDYRPDKILELERGRYIAAGLMILRAFIVAGKPDQKLIPFGSFDAWSDLVRSALVWLGEADPVVTKDALQAEDPERDKLSSLLTAWEAAIGTQPVTLARAVSIATTGERTNEREALLSAMLTAAGNIGRLGHDKIDTERLGKYLRHVKNKPVGGCRLCKVGETGGTARWQLFTGSQAARL